MRSERTTHFPPQLIVWLHDLILGESSDEDVPRVVLKSRSGHEIRRFFARYHLDVRASPSRSASIQSTLDNLNENPEGLPTLRRILLDLVATIVKRPELECQMFFSGIVQMLETASFILEEQDGRLDLRSVQEHMEGIVDDNWVLDFGPSSSAFDLQQGRTEMARTESLGDKHLASTLAQAQREADVVIVCAVRDVELEAVFHGRSWTAEEADPDDPSTYHRLEFSTQKRRTVRIVAGAPNQAGMPAAAVLATKMILRCHPKLVVMLGIAAGAKGGGRHMGDVLCPQTTFDYSSGKVEREGDALIFKPDPFPMQVSLRAVERVRIWHNDHKAELGRIRGAWRGPKPPEALSIHVGPLGSGPAVLATDAPVDEVRRHWRKLVGIEMEAYAVHLACNATVDPAPMFLCMKSVCDFAEAKDDQWQGYAAYTAAEVFFSFLADEWENIMPRVRS